MKNEVPWIGYCEDEGKAARTLLRGLKKNGYEIVQMPVASDAIVSLQHEHYDKIIISDRIPAGQMKFPIGINHFLYPVHFTKYVIESIRELPGYDTSEIIVPHFLVEEDKEIIQRADGRVHLVDLYSGSALEETLRRL